MVWIETAMGCSRKMKLGSGSHSAMALLVPLDLKDLLESRGPMDRSVQKVPKVSREKRAPPVPQESRAPQAPQESKALQAPPGSKAPQAQRALQVRSGSMVQRA